MGELESLGYVCHVKWSCEMTAQERLLLPDGMPSHAPLLDRARNETQMLQAIQRSDVDGLVIIACA